jgi:hypothetical protein
LALFCFIDGERFSFDIFFDIQTGELLHTGSIIKAVPQITSIKDYLMRASNKLSLRSTNVTISKEKFLEKIEEIPLFTNLIRVETFFRDRKQELKMKSLIDKFQLHVTFNVGTTQFIFKFNRDDFG